MDKTDIKRPEGITDEHLEFLDDLRGSGATNMFGAGAYLREEFRIDTEEASKILLYWMKTFGTLDR